VPERRAGIVKMELSKVTDPRAADANELCVEHMHAMLEIK
jgi:hypothetical protein